MPLINDGYAVQSTGYALMAHMNTYGNLEKRDRDSMMRWLQLMRNYFGAFASSQDTLVAMEALKEFTQLDPNRNIFTLQMTLESSATHGWVRHVFLNKDNYTNTRQESVSNFFCMSKAYSFISKK